jgi:flagellar biosynthesis protein FlhG
VALVVTSEPTSMTDAYATVKVLSQQQRRAVIRLIVNQTSRLGEARAIRDQLQRVVDRFVNPKAEQAVKLDLLGEIPADAMVRTAVQKRQLLLEAYPGSGAARAVKALAAKLVR